jgi:hypothetical protein
MELEDMTVLNTVDPKGRAGSSPAPATTNAPVAQLDRAIAF